MPSLTELVTDLPPRVHRVAPGTRQFAREAEHQPYSDEVHAQWLEDLDREAQLRGDMLPNVRPARVLHDEDLQRSIIADLIHELDRTVRGENEVGMLTGWGQGSHKDSAAEPMPAPSAVRGPAPVSNEGLRATLRSYLDAHEPCDRFDALVRHAATALLLAEQIATGNA